MNGVYLGIIRAVGGVDPDSIGDPRYDVDVTSAEGDVIRRLEGAIPSSPRPWMRAEVDTQAPVVGSECIVFIVGARISLHVNESPAIFLQDCTE